MSYFSDYINYTHIEYLQQKKLYRSTSFAGIGAFTGFIALVVYGLCHLCFEDITVSAVYSDGIFYYINYPLRKLSEFLPFSLAELLLYIAIICFTVFLIVTIYNTVVAVKLYFRIKRSGKHPEKRFMFRAAENFALRISAVFCFLIAAFIFFGGINYTGATFAERAGYRLGGYTVSQLEELCLYLGQNVSNTRQALVTNPDGSINEQYYAYNPYRLADEAKVAYSRLPAEYNSRHKDYPVVKFAYSSNIMSNIHITGIYPYVFPESVVNINTPIMSLPHTVCHEMAHQRGFAREDEANFIAYMACLQSDNPLMAYSAYYTAFTYAMDELYYYDSITWKIIMNAVDSGVRDDIEREHAYWKQFDTISSEFTSSVNNTYLTIMDVQDGVQSYSRMVELLLAEAVRSGTIE